VKLTEALAGLVTIMFMWVVYLYMTDSPWITPVLFLATLSVFTYGYMKYEKWCEPAEKEEPKQE